MARGVELSDKEWRERLTPEQYAILREQDTERAFTGPYWDTKQPGVYRCAGCGTELFRSDAKYDSGSGWPSYFIEDYAAQAAGFHTQLGSLICEGVFVKYPKLKVVLIESGISWLPPYLWRLAKSWRGVRQEVPWLDRSPEEFVRDHVRLTLHPFDAPPDAAHIGRIMDQLQSDQMLLFATDFPHWQFDGDDLLPAGIPAPLRGKILIDNALATYPRLGRSQ